MWKRTQSIHCLICQSSLNIYVYAYMCVCKQARVPCVIIIAAKVLTHQFQRERIKVSTAQKTDLRRGQASWFLFKHTVAQRSCDPCASCWLLEAGHSLSKVLWVIESGKNHWISCGCWQIVMYIMGLSESVPSVDISEPMQINRRGPCESTRVCALQIFERRLIHKTENQR